MNDSSDEEKVDQDKKDGSVSPRTLLAIQQALTEERDGAAKHRTLISSSPTKAQENIHHAVPQVVISSSEEETEPDHVKFFPDETSDFKGTGQRLHVDDSLLGSSSEDEMEDMISQRNKALRLAALQQPLETEMKSEEERKKEQLTEEIKTRSRRQTEKQEELERRESEQGSITKPQDAPASNQNTLSINLSAQLRGKPEETEIHPELLQQRSNQVIEAARERNGDDVKLEGSEESESEGTALKPADIKGAVNPKIRSTYFFSHL